MPPRRSSAILVLLVALSFAVAAESRAETTSLSVGDVCVLSASLKLSAKPVGRGKKTVLDEGAHLEILKLAKVWVHVETDGATGYVKRLRLQRLCEPAETEEATPPKSAEDVAEEEGEVPEVAAPVPPDNSSTQHHEKTQTAAPETIEEVPEVSAVPGTQSAAAQPQPPAEATPSETPVPAVPPNDEVSSAATPTTATTTPDEASAESSVRDPNDKIKIVVMDIRVSTNILAEMSGTLTTVVSDALDKLGAFKSISSQDIKQMMGFERQKDLLGCSDETSCLAEIGGALGADFLLAGSVALIEGTYLLQLQLIRIAQSRVESRVSREYSGGPKGLLDETRTAVKLVVRDILAQKSGQLVISVSEEGATIKIDSSIVGVSPLPALTVAGGIHTVEVEKEGFVRYSRDIEIQGQASTALTATLLPSEEYKRAYAKSSGRVRLLAWGGIGLGAAGFVAAGVVYGIRSGRAGKLDKDIEAYAQQDNRSETERQRLQDRTSGIGTLDGVAVGSVIAGVAVAATGLVLFFTGDDPERYEATTTVGPESSPSVELNLTPFGISLAGSF